jgi:hypothetical protein
MSDLRHIYRNLKLKHIPSKRYNRKYDPKYLDELASKGCSVKLGFGDFDGDTDLDGTYPKQRAVVAEKPGLHINKPLRGPRNLSFPPSEGPVSLSGAVLPEFGPTQLSAISLPVFGPSQLSAGSLPEFGPTVLSSNIQPPIAGPSLAEFPATPSGDRRVKVVKPALGPSNLQEQPEPQAGPISLGSTILKPSGSISTLGANVVVPGAGPSSLSRIVFPPSGFNGSSLNLNASIVAPSQGISNIRGTIPEYQNAVLFRGFDEFRGAARHSDGFQSATVHDIVFYGIKEYPGITNDSSYFTLVGWNGRFTGLLGVRKDDRVNEPGYTGYEISSITANEANGYYSDHDIAQEDHLAKFNKSVHGGFDRVPIPTGVPLRVKYERDKSDNYQNIKLSISNLDGSYYHEALIGPYSNGYSNSFYRLEMPYSMGSGKKPGLYMRWDRSAYVHWGFNPISAKPGPVESQLISGYGGITLRSIVYGPGESVPDLGYASGKAPQGRYQVDGATFLHARNWTADGVGTGTWQNEGVIGDPNNTTYKTYYMLNHNRGFTIPDLENIYEPVEIVDPLNAPVPTL